jgi:hypothetical protein
MIAANICRFIARVAVKQVIPHSRSEPLPELTQTWITGVADGSFPIIVMALLLSALIAGLGLYIIFSKRLSPDATMSAFAVVCCIGYAAAFISMGNTITALVVPFLPPVMQ